MVSTPNPAAPIRSALNFIWFWVLLLLTLDAYAGQLTLAWDANNQAGVAGYMLYYGQSSGTYTAKVDVGNNTTQTVSSLVEGQRYYFAATAYDGSRTESGFSNEVSATVPNSAPSTPVANFTADKTTGAAPLAVTFSDASSGTVTGWSWNFGDGASSTAQKPTHTYSAAGTYTVALTVTGPGGTNTKTVSGYINVSSTSSPPPTPPAPVANFTGGPATGTAPLAVAFTDASAGSVTAWSWSFGDGTTSTVQNPVHTYSAPGTYTVALTVTGPGGSNSKTTTGYITVSSSGPTPLPGLVAAYSFDEGAGRTVQDSSGHGNTGVISGATWGSPGRFGNALSFNGVNSWVTVNDSSSLDLTTGMTLEAWIYPTSYMTGWIDVMMKEQTGSDIYYLSANNADTNQPATGVFISSEMILRGGPSLQPNTWYHLAATYDGTTQRIYVNGSEVANRPTSGPIKTSNGPLRIGGDSIWGEYFLGTIDEVRIYNRALSAAEIQTDMNTPVSGQ